MSKQLLNKIANIKNKVQKAAHYDKKNLSDEVRGVVASKFTSRIEKEVFKVLGTENAPTKLDSNHTSSLVIAQSTFTSKAENSLTNLLTLSIIIGASTAKVVVNDSDIKVYCLAGATNSDVKALIDASSAQALISDVIAAGQGNTPATAALNKPFHGGL
jgi:hypothetical protein